MLSTGDQVILYEIKIWFPFIHCRGSVCIQGLQKNTTILHKLVLNKARIQSSSSPESLPTLTASLPTQHPQGFLSRKEFQTHAPKGFVNFCYIIVTIQEILLFQILRSTTLRAGFWIQTDWLMSYTLNQSILMPLNKQRSFLFLFYLECPFL